MFKQNNSTVEVVAIWDEPSSTGPDLRHVLRSNGSVRIKVWNEFGERVSAGFVPSWLGRIRYRQQLRQFRHGQPVTSPAL